MLSALDSLLAIQSTSLLEGGAAEAETSITLGDLRGTKAAVYDFWTTRCTNCPAALDALDAISRERPLVAFIGVNIDDAGAAREMVAKAASEGRWTSLSHAHLSEDDKERAKDILGMRTVPFYVVVGEDGTVLRHGSAKALPLKTVDSVDSALLQSSAAAVAPEGAGLRAEHHKENDSGIANAAVAVAADAVAAPAPTAREMECEGGVCKLVRKPKKVAAERETAAEAAAPVVSSSAAAPTAAAATATSAVPAPAARAMVCEGGACTLVRKPKKGASEQHSIKEPAAAEAGAGKTIPLGVGHTMPSLQVMPLDGGAATTIDDIRAGAPAVLDFWTTRCVRCPAALDALEGLSATATAAAACNTAYISLNLDSLDGANRMVSEGRWPSLSHVFAGGHDEASEALLEGFKARAGLKSVPFYVVLAADGRIDQIGGPKAVTLGPGPPASAPFEAASDARNAPAAPALAAAAVGAPKASPAFTMDEDF